MASETEADDTEQTRMADELDRIYDVLSDASEEAQTQRENAVIGLLFILTDYGRDVALQREHPTPNQKLVAAVGGDEEEMPSDPGSWPDYADDHDDYSMLVEWTDPSRSEGPEIKPNDSCPDCDEQLKFLDGEGPYCPSCGWRYDGQPRPTQPDTDGGDFDGE